MSKISLTEANKGETIDVHEGDEVVIQLKENPTTGYRWAIDKTDDKVLTPQNPEFSPGAGTGIGGGGTRTFPFTAQHHGTAHLHFKLWRSWTGDASITERFNVTIKVRN